jgi:hypothetical protein
VPLSTWASTSMRRASMPVIQKLVAVAIMRPRYGDSAREWVPGRAGTVAGRQRPPWSVAAQNAAGRCRTA